HPAEARRPPRPGRRARLADHAGKGLRPRRSPRRRPGAALGARGQPQSRSERRRRALPHGEGRRLGLCGAGAPDRGGRAPRGTALLRAVEERLTTDNGRLIVVETSSRADYASTRAFYERRGYTQAARLPGYYAPGDDLVIYLKDLTHGALATATA